MVKANVWMVDIWLNVFNMLGAFKRLIFCKRDVYGVDWAFPIFHIISISVVPKSEVAWKIRGVAYPYPTYEYVYAYVCIYTRGGYMNTK